MQRMFLVTGRLLLALLLVPLATACGSKAPATPSKGLSKEGITVTGKVFYKETPVTYGYVQFYERGALDPKSGMMYPTAVGMITREGTYKADNVPVGKDLHIAVACDPDKHLRELSGHVMGVSVIPGGAPEAPKGAPGKDRPAPKLPPGIPAGKGPPTPGRGPMENLSEEKKKMLTEVHRQFSSPMISGQMHKFEATESTYDIHLVPGKRK